MNDNTTDKRFFTAAEAARCLGISKATVLRHMNELPPEERAQGSYRGKPTHLVTEIGLVHLSTLISDAVFNRDALNEVNRSVPSETISDASIVKNNESNQGELIAELRARIADKDRQIADQKEEIRFLHDELKERHKDMERMSLLLLTAAQSAQDEGEPGEGVDTTPAADEAQDAPSAATVDGATVDPMEITRDTAPEITAAENQVKPKAGFWRRLQYLFRGE